MANEAYRAVFLRVHPTGKMVLSLTTDSDGREGEYAQLVAGELGVPALDVKVVPADTDRFGVGHGYNTSPSGGAPGAISRTTEKIRDKGRLLAAMALDAAPDTLEWRNGAWAVGDQLRVLGLAAVAVGGQAQDHLAGRVDAQEDCPVGLACHHRLSFSSLVGAAPAMRSRSWWAVSALCSSRSQNAGCGPPSGCGGTAGRSQPG